MLTSNSMKQLQRNIFNKKSIDNVQPSLQLWKLFSSWVWAVKKWHTDLEADLSITSENVSFSCRGTTKELGLLTYQPKNTFYHGSITNKVVYKFPGRPARIPDQWNLC